MPAVKGNGAAVDFRGVVTGSEGVVWGQVGVALRDADTVRRIACAETGGEEPALSTDAAWPPT